MGGGGTWASIATMLQTCKMNSVDPYAWAKLDVGTHRQSLAKQRNRGIDALELQVSRLNGLGRTLTRHRNGRSDRPEAVVASFEDVAAMGETVEQRGCHFRIAEYDGPIPEAQVWQEDFTT